MLTMFASCYNLLLYLLVSVHAAVNFLVSLLPIKLQKQVNFQIDTARSIFYIVFGKLLPELHIPNKDLSGKVAIVTGSNSGIGFQIASDLAQRNAIVYLACRTKSKADKAVDAIITKFPHARGKVKFLPLDTSDLQNIRDFARKWSSEEEEQQQQQSEPQKSTVIDILVHNAGIAEPPSKNQKFTPEGLEITYATNFLGSFLLTFLLEEHLNPKTARVIFTSSTAQTTGKFSNDFALDPAGFRTKAGGKKENGRYQMEPGFHHPVVPIPVPFIGRYQYHNKTPFAVYSNTKAMQCAFARCLQERFNRRARLAGQTAAAAAAAGVGQVAHCFSPDLTSTPILTKGDPAKFWSNPVGWLLREVVKIAIDTSQGAATGTWLAICDDESVVNPQYGGAYWDRMNRFTSSTDLFEQDLLDRFWTRWENDAEIEWR